VRGIDFLRVAFELFDGRPLLMCRLRGAKKTVLSIGLIEGKIFAVVWTCATMRCGIITARRARDEEEKRYRRYTAKQIRNKIARGEDRTIGPR